MGVWAAIKGWYHCARRQSQLVGHQGRRNSASSCSFYWRGGGWAVSCSLHSGPRRGKRIQARARSCRLSRASCVPEERRMGGRR
jgi:hypothetical protein